ncbi:MAG: Jag N-terminal domain-containing protein [Desulfobulbaceae bacterium]|jgi:spoIIIJ-associated protein|nr:Jag N-terminal domain-containing protein [Desulfobulbaceae bacterium]
MAKKFQFKGKDIDDAVNKACARFGVGRDELNIDVVSTGSTGIFGLLKKQSSIEAWLKSDMAADVVPEKTPVVADDIPGPEEVVEDVGVEPGEESPTKPEKAKVQEPEEAAPQKSRPRYRPPQHTPVPVPEEFHAGLKDELLQLLKLMGMEGEITFGEENGKTALVIQGQELIEPLTARDGQALDGLQYLLRKISSHTLPENGMFVVDIDGFRGKRRAELQELAITLADEVKEKNVTRTIPPLNPSERRIVHMHLQDDTSIRSRSVGSGLFKKILIYQPGTRKRPSRNKRANRPRGGRGQDQDGNK